ncbi:MAG TPA: AAA family ATPase [Acidimicrobiia bacterium]|nr:AAA family ATPase [Acidimicrobiia bacterium]
MKRIVVAGASDQFYGRLQQALPDAGDRVYRWVEQLDGPAVVEAILALDPATVVLGPELPARLALALASEFDRARPDVSVIVSLPPDPAAVEAALAAGVRAVLKPGASKEDIRDAVLRAVRVVEARRSSPQPGRSRRHGARVITVCAPKGGAGKTMLSTNLAVGLAAAAPRQTVIVDLDLQFGDVAYSFSLKPRHSIYDAVTTPQPLDLTTLKVFLTRHQSELYALCAPDDPARGEMVAPEAVSEIVSLLMAEFQYVIIDTGAGLTEHTLSALDVSTDVVFVADMDIPSVRHLRKVLNALDRLGMSAPDRHFVMNRADSRVGLSMADAAAAAGITIDVEVPSSRHVPVALNTGMPILLGNPRSPVSRKIWDLVGRFADLDDVNVNRRTMKWSA